MITGGKGRRAETDDLQDPGMADSNILFINERKRPQAVCNDCRDMVV